MMDKYNCAAYESELYHYGVPGMKWGHRKARIYENKARIARESAKEWKEIGANKASKLKAKGKSGKASKVEAKYKKYAQKDRNDAKKYDEKLKVAQRENKFREARGNVNKTRSRGAKIATNLLGGAYANRTYNSVIAAGGSKGGARAMTALGAATGPLGQALLSSYYTKEAGKRKTAKRYK